MDIRFFRRGESVATELGPYGHSMPRYVFSNRPLPPNPENWPAGLISALPHGMRGAIVGISPSMRGGGLNTLLAMPAGIAIDYAPGTAVVAHYRKDRLLGWGTLVAVSISEARPVQPRMALA